MRKPVFVLDKAQFREQILKGDMTEAMLRERAEAVKPTGNSIIVETDWTPTRVRVRIVDDSWRAMFREAREGHLSRAIGLSAGDGKVWYTTKSGNRRLASQAQVANWTRGKR